MYKNVVKEYLNEIFSSKDMAEYVSENIDTFEKWRVLDMICHAPIPLSKKSYILNLMSKHEALEESRSDDLFDPPYTIRNCIAEVDKALAELNLKEGELFILYEYDGSDNNRINSITPFLNYKQVVDYHRKNKEDYIEKTWHILEKWIPNKNGKLVNIMDYYIFNTEIVGCRSHCRIGMENYFEMDSNINIPEPFKCGDIIEIDARPMHKKQRAVVVGIGDNRDCCALQVVFITENGELGSGALKHAAMYENWNWILSPLYSAKIYDGELEGKEVVFTKIQKFIRENFDLWNDVEVTLPLHDATLADITDEYLQDLLQELKLLQKRVNARKQRGSAVD